MASGREAMARHGAAAGGRRDRIWGRRKWRAANARTASSSATASSDFRLSSASRSPSGQLSAAGRCRSISSHLVNGPPTAPIVHPSLLSYSRHCHLRNPTPPSARITGSNGELDGRPHRRCVILGPPRGGSELAPLSSRSSRSRQSPLLRELRSAHRMLHATSCSADLPKQH